MAGNIEAVIALHVDRALIAAKGYFISFEVETGIDGKTSAEN